MIIESVCPDRYEESRQDKHFLDAVAVLALCAGLMVRVNPGISIVR